MKKLHRLTRGLFLLVLLASFFSQCSKDDGGDTSPTTTTPQAVTISASDFSSSINENPAQGASIGTVQASASSGSLNYTIVSQSVAGAIAINSSNGNLTVADPAIFDYETRQQITATVRVSVGSTTEEVSVTISINDVNEVDVASLTLWEGVPITFSKPNEGNPNNEANQDRITDNVWLTRGDVGILYNIVSEASANNSSSPAGTEWAQGTFADLSTLEFTNFRAACPGAKPKNVVGIPMVLHLIQDDIYIEITITSWAQGKVGGFTYIRSTP